MPSSLVCILDFYPSLPHCLYLFSLEDDTDLLRIQKVDIMTPLLALLKNPDTLLVQEVLILVIDISLP